MEEEESRKVDMALDYTTADKYTLYNLDEIVFPGNGPFDIPVVKPEKWDGSVDYIGFNYANTCRNRWEKGVHFFIDDYQFERIWGNWKRYSRMLAEFRAIIAPDFSMYTDWPVAVQIWNYYRRHFCAAYLQEIGATVYPKVGWADKKSLKWCFDGDPEGGCVAVSSVGTQRYEDDKRMFKYGYDAMLERLHPETIIFYGDVPKDCRGNIVNIRPFHDKFMIARMSDF